MVKIIYWTFTIFKFLICTTSFYYVSTTLYAIRASKMLFHKSLFFVGVGAVAGTLLGVFVVKVVLVQFPDSLVTLWIKFFLGAGAIDLADLADLLDLELEPRKEPEPIKPLHEMTREERAKTRELEGKQALRQFYFWYFIFWLLNELTKP